MQRRLLPALAVLFVIVSNLQAEISLDGKLGDEVPTLVYDANTGDLTLECDGTLVAMLELVASEPIFVGEKSEDITTPFGRFGPEKIFTIKPDGFERIRLGKCLQPKLKLY